jgi:hypothetical protein
MRRVLLSWAFAGVVSGGNLLAHDSTSTHKPYLTVGLFLGRLEEGARRSSARPRASERIFAGTRPRSRDLRPLVCAT